MPLHRQLVDLLTGQIRGGVSPLATGFHLTFDWRSLGESDDTLRARPWNCWCVSGDRAFSCCPGEFEVVLFSLGGATSVFRRQGLTADSPVWRMMEVVTVKGNEDNSFDDGRAIFFPRKAE